MVSRNWCAGSGTHGKAVPDPMGGYYEAAGECLTCGRILRMTKYGRMRTHLAKPQGDERPAELRRRDG